MRQPRQRLFVAAVLLACVPAQAIAEICNERLDHDSNPLLVNRRDESLLLLSKQGVMELQEWECQSLPCTSKRRITRFDQQGRIMEVDDDALLIQHSYEGAGEYPSRSVWTLTRDSFRPKGFLRESTEKYTADGVLAGDTRWISNGTVATFRDPASGYSKMYLRGRLVSSVEMSMGWDGFPSNTLVERDCKIRQEVNGVTYVAASLKSKELPQRLINEARFSPAGDLIWNLVHLPDGSTFEDVYEVVASDRKGNWTAQRSRNSSGETSTRYRKITYWD